MPRAKVAWICYKCDRIINIREDYEQIYSRRYHRVCFDWERDSYPLNRSSGRRRRHRSYPKPLYDWVAHPRAIETGSTFNKQKEETMDSSLQDSVNREVYISKVRRVATVAEAPPPMVGYDSDGNYVLNYNPKIVEALAKEIQELWERGGGDARIEACNLMNKFYIQSLN